MRRLKIFFDGGARPNPGRIEVAVVARGVSYFIDDLGEGSNGDAEWLALIEALKVAQRVASGPFDLIGDSRVVIDGLAKAGGTYRDHFLALAAPQPPTRVRWIGRAQNLAGIALERRRSGYSQPPPKAKNTAI